MLCTGGRARFLVRPFVKNVRSKFSVTRCVHVAERSTRSVVRPLVSSLYLCEHNICQKIDPEGQLNLSIIIFFIVREKKCSLIVGIYPK